MPIKITKELEPSDDWQVWRVEDPEDGKVLWAKTWEYAVFDLACMMIQWRKMPNRGWVTQ